MILGLALVSLAIWLVLILARGFFWLARERDDRNLLPAPVTWPAIVAVVPARDEADVIAHSVGSLMRQDYPGPFRVVLVDDRSTDGTATATRAAAESADAADRLEIVTGAPTPPGWAGKPWAMAQGAERAGPTDFILFTDADIGHAPDTLRLLATRAVAEGRVLTSLMARLHCETPVERFLIPAFVFFFAMLYPFARVNRGRAAAAAGGVMLVRREALEAAGGIASIRAEIIDDCALARRLAAQGPIWLGLTDRALSLRPYSSFAEIGRMVSRSAYAQLRYSPLLLAGTVLGMAVTYLAPPLLALFATGPTRAAGVAAWALMAVAFLPMLRFYRASPLWALALPAIGAAYTWFTLTSAVQVWRGRGGMWKGRAQALAGRA